MTAPVGTDMAKSPRPKPPMGVPVAWWPVALSDEIRRHPRAFRLGDRDLAVYRDLGGVVRAVDDSCPHRRLPLSLGRITEDGYLQCAYHGWCFDGATGRCTAIPNLHEDEKIPGAIRVDAFATAETVADVLGYGLRTSRLAPAVGPPTGDEPEDGTLMFDTVLSDGLVLVWTGDDTPLEQPAESAGEALGSRFAGRAEVRAPHDRVSAALLHNPGRALGLGALLGSGDAMSRPDVVVEGDTISVHRERIRLDVPRPHTYDPPWTGIVATTVRMVARTGLCRIEVERPDGAPALRMVVGLTPLGGYRTIMRWHGEAEGRQARLARLLSRAGARTGRTTAVAERLADGVREIFDPAIRRLQELRAEEAP